MNHKMNPVLLRKQRIAERKVERYYRAHIPELVELIERYEHTEMTTNCGPESFVAGFNRCHYTRMYEKITGKDYTPKK